MVFVCVDMTGGAQYRNAIVRAVQSCKIFLILLNEQWALSGECEDEYNLAKRLNLTSHEKGRTKRDSEQRLPIMLPIAFPNLNWDGHLHVKLLAASTNFILHNADDLLSGNSSTTLDDVVRALKNAGISIDESRPPTSKLGGSEKVKRLLA